MAGLDEAVVTLIGAVVGPVGLAVYASAVADGTVSVPPGGSSSSSFE